MRHSLLLLALTLAGCFNEAPCTNGDRDPLQTFSGAGGTAGTGGGDGGIGLPPCGFIPDCALFAEPEEGKLACDDGDPATIDRCVIVNICGGVCVNIDGPCDSLDPLAVQKEQCNGGKCVGNTCVPSLAPSCVPDCIGGPCTIAMCEGGVCTVTPVPDGTTCGAGFMCKAGVCTDAG